VLVQVLVQVPEQEQEQVSVPEQEPVSVPDRQSLPGGLSLRLNQPAEYCHRYHIRSTPWNLLP
jgi:hypothetical protein